MAEAFLALIRARATHQNQFKAEPLKCSALGGMGQILPSTFPGEAMQLCMFPRSVHVRSYVRFRLGRLESVCEHCRSLPGQLTLFS